MLHLIDTHAPSHVLCESLSVDWALPEMSVFVRYENDGEKLRRITRALEMADLKREWLSEVNARRWLKGRSYRLFAQYRISQTGNREFCRLVVRDARNLSSPGAQVIKVCEVEL